MSISEIRNILSEANIVKEEGPLPLRRSEQQLLDYPVDSLPPILREAVLGLHDKIQAPIAMCAQSILSTVNLVVQGHADIMLPYGHRKPLSCFFISIGDSGERKTSCDYEILSVVEEHEAKLKEKFQKDYSQWKIDFEIWTVEKQAILKNKKQYPSFKDKQKAIQNLGPAPQQPPQPMMTCSEPTYEGLYRLLKDGLPSVGIFSSEGGQFISGHGMKDDNKIKTSAGLSNLWDGKSIKKVRASEDITTLSNKRVSMHLMAQPLVVRNLLSDEHLKDQGLLSRLLCAFPKSTVGTRFSRAPEAKSLKALEIIKIRIKEILNMPYPTNIDNPQELQPRTLIFDTNAIRLFHGFSNYVEESMGAGKLLENIKGFASKLPEHAARIAGTLAMFEDFNTKEISYDYLKRGIEIAQYYANEALRLFDEGITDPDILTAEKLLYWLQNYWEGEYISLPNIYQEGPSDIRTRDKAQKFVKILASHNWLKKIDGSRVIKDRKRTEIWKIIKG